jgi:hypothetical protein
MLTLMLAGAIPFLLSILFLHNTWLSHAKVLEIVFTYAAIVLTFLGGVEWGIGVIRFEENKLNFPYIFILSILPSLAAWLLVLLDFPKLQLIGFILSFIIVLGVDIALTLQKIIPTWFLKLRIAITLIVVTLLILIFYAF